ncbi:hypothetical protein J2T57_001307 [Natronocella acetinitrilica]|uniref:Uncharacterized protein n=1 Tax=Natronocella acetinitrilica TaxID=414046 RepID=A0AAE3G1Z5_9GAMM|nr:flagellar transcriptional regulator FlhD [Natronocella acetinitrilica]MCP1674205.1 hypothetical protein [Natronocella acetinitrilica]
MADADIVSLNRDFLMIAREICQRLPDEAPWRLGLAEEMVGVVAEMSREMIAEIAQSAVPVFALRLDAQLLGRVRAARPRRSALIAYPRKGALHDA